MVGKYMKRWPKGVPVSLDWLRRWVLDIPESGCWVWMGTTNPGGYGLVGYNGKTKLSHRVAYELKFGPIPEGLDLDHLCRVRCCVNPDHLEPVSRSENLRRGETGDNLVKSALSVTHCPSGHEYTPENTFLRKDRPGHRGCRACRRNATNQWYRKSRGKS